jgi:hypothetical protein
VEQAELLRYAIDALEGMKLSYAIVGSFASGAYGEPRFTQDIDIVIDLHVDHIDNFCQKFPEPEFYLSKPAVREAVARLAQFNVIHPSSGNKIDFILVRPDAWGKSQLVRRQAVAIFDDRTGYLASPEDVILGKLVDYRKGGSEKHLRDITGILKVRHGDVDHDYIAQFAERLGVTEVWEAVLNRINDHSDEDHPK